MGIGKIQYRKTYNFTHRTYSRPLSARCVEMGNRRFGGGARDVVCSYFLLFFIAYVELLRVFWFLWREILECSPYLQIRCSAENGTGPTDSINYSSKSLIYDDRKKYIICDSNTVNNMKLMILEKIRVIRTCSSSPRAASVSFYANPCGLFMISAELHSIF